jgi:hypothetical protein
VAPRSPQTTRRKSIFDTALTQRFESARRLSALLQDGQERGVPDFRIGGSVNGTSAIDQARVQP